MGSLTTFAVVGNSVTNTGATAICGNVALTGSSAYATVDFPSITNGVTYIITNSSAVQAKSDLSNAKTDASNHASTAIISDPTAPSTRIVSGVYTVTAAYTIEDGMVINLDAENNPNAFWIFNIGAALTLGNNVRVAITNPASSAVNVWWNVQSSATTGTGCTL
eukprot:gene28260-35092_t